MKNLRAVVLLSLASTIAPDASGPATVHNDDSCDIGTAPAATLLLPYFEVDVTAPEERATTTLFTVVNTSHQPQIAHVTVWTDWAYPVLTFNIFLTGYDVQAINLYDVLVHGVVAPPEGTANNVLPGARSASNVTGNANFLESARVDCGGPAQGDGSIAPLILDEVRRALTAGQNSACGSSRIGGTHTHALGYLTIDVVSTCTSRTPLDPLYYSDELLFDNTLIGDYQQVWPNAATGDFAQGGAHSFTSGRFRREVRPVHLPLPTFHIRSTTATRHKAIERPIAVSRCHRHLPLGTSTTGTTDSRPISKCGGRA